VRAAAHLARALSEGSLAAAALVLLTAAVAPLEPVNALWAALGIGAAYAGIAEGVVVAYRARPAEGGRRRRIGLEAGILGAGIGCGFLVSLIAIAIAGVLRPGLTEATVTRVGDTVRASIALAVGSGVTMALGFLVAYVVGRPLVIAWPGWVHLRATRLLWALTHAQLVGALALSALVALAALIALALATQPVFLDLGADPAAQDVLASPANRLLLVALPTALAVAFAGLAAAAILVPLVALASYRSLRRTTGRLERLADTTGELRLGALDTRVAVTGEDEVGRLEADFNAMAADLEAAVTDLETQRDAVARLLAQRRELIAAVSHELRTPVATLRAHLDSALERWDGEHPPPTLRADLVVMNAEASWLQRLIDDLFDAARAEVGRLPLSISPTDLGRLLAQSVEALRPYALRERRVELALEVPAEVPLAHADPGRLDQVVRNLLVNAIRYAPPGGVIRVSAAAAGHDDLVIEVEDMGPGIPSDDLPRIWERLYRGPRSPYADQRGAGLGLALVKELTEAMGGRVSVTSELGRGSCFSVHLREA
jgi:signal transduction histidine kinase